MKKLIAFLLLVALVLPVVAADETATVTLKAMVGETATNSGIRVKDGDHTGVATSVAFDTLFYGAADALTIVPLQDVSLGTATGYFTVLVRRAVETPVDVTMTADPLRTAVVPYQYLGYRIHRGGTVVIDTTMSPTTPVAGVEYEANGVLDDTQIRDVAVFRYEVPQNMSVPFGEYTANIYYTLTIP